MQAKKIVYGVNVLFSCQCSHDQTHNNLENSPGPAKLPALVDNPVYIGVFMVVSFSIFHFHILF